MSEESHHQGTLKVVLIGKLLIINIINRQPCILRGNCQKLYNKELSKQILKKKGQLGNFYRQQGITLTLRRRNISDQIKLGMNGVGECDSK